MLRRVSFQGVANRLLSTTFQTIRSSSNVIDAKVLYRKKIGFNKKTKNQLIREKEEKLKNMTLLLDEPHILENSEALEVSLINDGMNRNTSIELTDAHKRESKRLKFLIWQKKYMKEMPEFSVLTWSAKEQIHYLHNTDAEKWTFEALAEHFPITAKGVRKLLNSSYNLSTVEQVLMHDQKVKIKWNKIISQADYESLHPGFKWLFNEGKSSLFIFANGNPNLPAPPKSYIELLNDMEKNRPTGPYESLVKGFYLTESSTDKKCPYAEEKESLSKEFESIIDLVKEATHSVSVLNDSKSAQESEFEKFMKTFSPNVDEGNISKKKVITLKNDVYLDFSERLLYKYT